MNWWKRLLRREEQEASLDKEVTFHIEERVSDLMRSGVSEQEARRRVRLEFGGDAQVKEACRDARPTHWIEMLGQDLRYAMRNLRGSPGFAAVAIATLALGIGGLTAVFSAVDAILIRPLPYTAADRLVMIWDSEIGTGAESKMDPTPAEWVEWRRLNTVFTGLASTQPGDLTLSSDGEPEQVPTRKVTWTFWNVLGAPPILGRGFTEDEDNNGGHVVVISYGLWQRRFGGASNIVGRRISLNDQPYEVVGVMPRNFYFMPSREIDLWVPASFPPWMRRELTWHDAQIVARLKPGITLEHARQSMHALSLQVTAKNFRGPRSVLLTPLRDEIAGKTKTALLLLLSASMALLLIACVNLANLLLSRGAARGREVAVRVALGAGRRRLIAQFLTESLLLAGFGALAGLALALPGMRFLERLVPEAMGAARLTLDWRVLGFCVAVAVAAALTFGLAPAFRGSRVDPQEGLRTRGRGAAGARSHRFQHSLIVIETSLAVVLLTCGGLLVQTFRHLRNTEVGFTSQKLLTFEMPMFRYKEFARRVAHINATVDAVRALPGVVDVGAINHVPFTNAATATFYWLEGQPRSEIRNQVALMRNVTRDYFPTVGATLLDGRFFSAADQASQVPLAIINETFASRHYGGRSPVGQRFKYGNTGEKGYWYTIVGVVRSIREGGVLAEMRPTIYRLQEHCDQMGTLDTGIVVRTAVSPSSVVPAVRQAIWSIDKVQPIARVRTMEDIVDRQLSTPTQSTALLSAFAVLALLLASVGLYGVLSYAVMQRTNEIGIRMALGATSRDILLSFGGRGLALTIAGLVVGFALAALAARSMTALLYGFRPDYVPTVAVVSAILLGVAALACLLPARRASRIDPVVALRNE